MFNSILMRGSFLAVLSSSLLLFSTAGFGASVFESEKGILRYVPADTPYLLATGKGLPDDMLDKFEPRIDEMLGAYQIAVREIAETELAKNDDEMSAEQLEKTSAVVDRLISLMSINALRDAGFERNSQLAFYSHGLLPVLRIELSSNRAFENVIAEIEKSAGEKLDTAKVAGNSYRYIGDEDMRFIMGAFDGNAVFAFVPTGLPEKLLRVMLGFDLPKENVAETSQLVRIAQKYGFTDHYIGYIDVEQLVSTVLEPPEGIQAALFDSLEDHPSNYSKVCKQEIHTMAGIAPRMVFGYDEITSNTMTGSLIVEMRDDIAAGLSTIAALVPGLGADAGGLFSFGASFNLLALREFYSAQLDAMEEDPYECEFFAALQAGVAKGREALNQPLPPFVYGLRGFNAVFDDIVGLDLAKSQPPESVDASVVIAMENAEAMLAMGAMLSPELATLNIQADGVPVALELPSLQTLSDTSFAAMSDGALAVSVGSEAESRVTDVLNADPTKPPPVFGMTMDAGSYYEFIGETMMLDDQLLATGDGEDGEAEDVGLSPTARAALRDAMVSLGAIYDRMSMDMRFTGRGIEIDSHVTLKD